MFARQAQPGESRELREWIVARHYLQSAPPGYRVALEFLDGDRNRIGAMLLGRPTSRKYDERCWLELTRMFFIDEAPPNTESRALAMMRRWVRRWMPEVRALIAYSDPAAGHTGTVYRADNWAPFGFTTRTYAGWRTRPGRRQAEEATPKARWIRTP